MFVVLDDEKNITQIGFVGKLLEEDEYNQTIPDDTPKEIIENIFNYKYINKNFIEKEGITEKLLSTYKEIKLKALSSICYSTITKGAAFNNSHYSLEETDQINLYNTYLQMEKGNPIVYHADGEPYRAYTSEEFSQLYFYLEDFKTFHRIYYSFLKSMVAAATNLDELTQIYYGIPIEDSYKSLFKNLNFEIPITKDTSVEDYIEQSKVQIPIQNEEVI